MVILLPENNYADGVPQWGLYCVQFRRIEICCSGDPGEQTRSTKIHPTWTSFKCSIVSEKFSGHFQQFFFLYFFFFLSFFFLFNFLRRCNSLIGLNVEKYSNQDDFFTDINYYLDVRKNLSDYLKMTFLRKQSLILSQNSTDKNLIFDLSN